MRCEALRDMQRSGLRNYFLEIVPSWPPKAEYATPRTGNDTPAMATGGAEGVRLGDGVSDGDAPRDSDDVGVGDLLAAWAWTTLMRRAGVDVGVSVGDSGTFSTAWAWATLWRRGHGPLFCDVWAWAMV